MNLFAVAVSTALVTKLKVEVAEREQQVEKQLCL